MANTPAQRSSKAKKRQEMIRRKHKVNLNRPKKYLPGEEAAIEDQIVVLALAGYSKVQMAQVVGVSRGQVREILLRPKVSERVVELRMKIPAAALELIQGLMIESVLTLAEVMRKSRNEKYIIQAAESILDRGGLPKSSRQERHNLNESSTTLKDDGILDKLRTASPEVQEEAAKAIEQLEEILARAADVEVETETDEQTD